MNPEAMMLTPAPKTFTDAAETMVACGRPVLLTHERPDGDAYGALTAMRALLRGQGVDATAIVLEPLPDRYAVFQRYPPISVLGRDVETSDLRDVDGVIVVDTCSYSQLGPMAAWVRDTDVPKVAIDHHCTRDELADVYVIDETAAAACLIVYDLARAVHWPIERDAAEAMFIGIATDTGWFRHANTDARALAAAAELARQGAHVNQLYDRLYLSDSVARVRLLGAALASLELLCDRRLAVMTLPADRIADTGASIADTEDIINEPMRIGRVVVAVLLIDQGDGVIRASLRSKPPWREDAVDVDVAAVASALGGGGHARAAGVRLRGPWTQARDTVINAVRDVLERS